MNGQPNTSLRSGPTSATPLAPRPGKTCVHVTTQLASAGRQTRFAREARKGDREHAPVTSVGPTCLRCGACALLETSRHAAPDPTHLLCCFAGAQVDPIRCCRDSGAAGHADRSRQMWHVRSVVGGPRRSWISRPSVAMDRLGRIRSSQAGMTTTSKCRLVESVVFCPSRPRIAVAFRLSLRNKRHRRRAARDAGPSLSVGERE
jgi:hypothetical protein